MEAIEQKIDDFLLDRLPEAERTAFETALATDPELAKALHLQKEMMGGVQVLGREQFKTRLRSIQQAVQAEDTLPSPPTSQVNRSWLWWLLGAIAIGLILLFVWLSRVPAETPSGVYADFFEPFAVSIIQRDPSENALFDALKTAYDSRDYNTFINRFSPLQTGYTHHPELLLALGISYLATDQLDEADRVLEGLENGNYSAYRDQAQWYRALAAVRDNNPPKAKTMLDRLATDPLADHHKEAKRLLKRLNRLK